MPREPRQPYRVRRRRPFDSALPLGIFFNAGGGRGALFGDRGPGARTARGCGAGVNFGRMLPQHSALPAHFRTSIFRSDASLLKASPWTVSYLLGAYPVIDVMARSLQFWRKKPPTQSRQQSQKATTGGVCCTGSTCRHPRQSRFGFGQKRGRAASSGKPVTPHRLRAVRPEQEKQFRG